MTACEAYQRALARQQRLRRQKASCRMEQNIVRVEFAEPEGQDTEDSPRIYSEEEYFEWLHRAKPKATRKRRVKREEWEFVEPDWDWDGTSYK